MTRTNAHISAVYIREILQHLGSVSDLLWTRCVCGHHWQLCPAVCVEWLPTKIEGKVTIFPQNCAQNDAKDGYSVSFSDLVFLPRNDKEGRFASAVLVSALDSGQQCAGGSVMCPSLVVTPLLHSPPLPFVSAAEERAGEMLANYPPRPGLLPPSVCLVLVLLQCCQGGQFSLPIFTTIHVEIEIVP